MRIILIDNYDSFTYNIVHYLERWGATVTVVFNDAETPDWSAFDACVLSPGPGLPQESGRLMQWIHEWESQDKPMLGICLGLQALVLHYGGSLRRLEAPLHGVEGIIPCVEAQSLWSRLSFPQTIAHYHSWVADTADFPAALQITALDSRGEVMVVEDRQRSVFGVQFHPESIMTPNGDDWIALWCNFVVTRKRVSV